MDVADPTKKYDAECCICGTTGFITPEQFAK